MSEVTRLLSAIEAGETEASERLLPLVYEELRRLAARQLAQQPAGQTLQATGLVHEAYLRLVDADEVRQWNGRGHFFVAAAEAMRRIVIESVRRKRSLKRGRDFKRRDIEVIEIAVPEPSHDLLALDEALDRLAAVDPDAARLVQLRYFTGLSIDESATALGVSPRTADRLWSYARAFLLKELRQDS